MSDLQGIAVTPIEPSSNVGLTPANPVKEASLVTERKLFEYLAQQSLANSVGGSALANPSALAGQATRQLRGFIERMSLDNQTWKKGRVMSSEKEGAQALNASQAEEVRLHPGPGREKLSPSDSAAERTETVNRVSDKDYDFIIDAMARSMQFSLQANAIISGSANVMRSAQSLMKGQ